MNERLTAQVKRKLNITWSDEDTDARVQDIIQSAIPVMLHKLGIADPDFDFGEPGMENNLFKAYCLYDWNHALNEFDDNYANDIAQTQARHDIKYFMANEVECHE